MILVSHDRRLIETTADRLWLVAGGGVQPFDGDLEDYRRFLLSGEETPAREEAAPKRSKEEARRESAEVELRQGLVDRVAGEAEPAPLAPRFGLAHFELQELLQDLGSRELLRQGAIEGGAELLGCGGEAEIGQALPQAPPQAGPE